MTEPEFVAAETEGRRSPSIRQQAWFVAGILLVVLGALPLAAGLVGLATGGEVAFLVLALPPAAAGVLVLRRVSAVRTTAVSVALAYAAFALYVATTALRGPAPEDGSAAPGPDLVLLLVGVAFGAAAVLTLLGDQER